jgi:2-polyprenyl-6-methoxyphenol hydroxylase-like FAD-dependent oxidoreductase
MRIAISGAGVAGAALAHWLHRSGHIPTVIEKAPKFRTDGYMIDFWGRVLLIGDAAACISLLGGGGTGLAITEAYVLAGELARTGADYRGAFDAYEARLRPFIASKQAGAVRYIPFFATRTRFGLWFRTVAMRTMNFGPLAILFAGSVRDDFELPDYGLP